MPQRTGASGGTSRPLTPEEEAALRAQQSAPTDPYATETATAPPPPTNYIPGSTYVPPSQTGYVENPVSTLPPQDGQAQLIDPLYVPGSGVYGTHKALGSVPATPIAGLGGTGEQLPPQEYIPGSSYIPPWESSRYVPPPPPAPVASDPTVSIPREPGVMPGPPRNYVPGSTYVPDLQAKPGGVNRAFVPGTRAFGGTNFSKDVPYSPGLGGNTVEQRPLAPRNPRIWTQADPREPQGYIPGSTYVPEYLFMGGLGGANRLYRPTSESGMYGGSRPSSMDEMNTMRQRYPPSSGTHMVATTYPASGAPETIRGTGYAGGPTGDKGNVVHEGTSIERISDDSNRPANPNAHPMFRTDILAQMEEGRQARQRKDYENFLLGIFGSGE